MAFPQLSLNPIEVGLRWVAARLRERTRQKRNNASLVHKNSSPVAIDASYREIPRIYHLAEDYLPDEAADEASLSYDRYH